MVTGPSVGYTADRMHCYVGPASNRGVPSNNRHARLRQKACIAPSYAHSFLTPSLNQVELDKSDYAVVNFGPQFGYMSQNKKKGLTQPTMYRLTYALSSAHLLMFECHILPVPFRNQRVAVMSR